MSRGAQARTFLARDEKSDGAVVIVKQFQIRGGAWKAFDLFEREARTLSHLNHPGIPKVHAYIESEPGVLNLVMERAPGASLRAIATRARCTDRDITDILVRTLDILHYLHGRTPPVIHRDIKPANIVRAANGSIVLVDFGGVRQALREEGGSTVIGTFGYMAPEQLHGEASPATDIYGLGATMVALAGGIEPENVVRRGLRMDLATHLPKMEGGLRDVLQAMVEPEPENRPQSARQVRKLLSLAAKGRTAPAPPRAPAPAPARIRETHDDDDFTANLPGPAAAVLRVLTVAFATLGYGGLTIAQIALVPLVFALVGALTADDKQPKLDATRTKVHLALDEGRHAFLDLQSRATRRRALPPSDRPE
ncbi:MAG TPA: serine/threonine-protein kinase [Kofleriaceae bacterium]|nr:serine/threonine-protein kinase [Kofleriaceae bacterium]